MGTLESSLKQDELFDVEPEVVEKFLKLMHIVESSQGIMTWENAPAILTIEQADKLLQL